MTNRVYQFGTSPDIAIGASEKIAIFSKGKAKVYYKDEYSNVPSDFYYSSSLDNEEVLLTPGVSTVRIEAKANEVLYSVGSAPVIIETPITIDTVYQAAQTAKTTSATLTAAEVLTGIITVNQGAASTSAQQLPLATAMDTALPDFGANDAFDFSVINISTVDAEDASVTTNTGWTLVGNMDIHAYSAAGSLNSSARFRARKTATGAWTLYRIS